VIPAVATWYWGADGADSGKWKLSAYGASFPTPVITATATNIGIGTTAPGAQLVVSANAAPLRPAAAGTQLQVANIDGTSTRVLADVYGGANAGFTVRKANGTAAVPTALANGDVIGTFYASGYGTNAYFEGKAGINLYANEAWTNTAQGTFLTLRTTLNGSTTTSEAVRVDHNGNVGIGAAPPVYKLHVKGVAGAGGAITSIDSGPTGADTTTNLVLYHDFAAATVCGAVARTGTNQVLFVTSSDGRLKSDIAPSGRGLDALLAIKVSDYRMGETASQGLLAQDVARVYPEAVHEGGKDPNLEPWMIDYGRLTPLLIRAVQELAAEVAALKAAG
jgi:hypothetical protein